MDADRRLASYGSWLNFYPVLTRLVSGVTSIGPTPPAVGVITGGEVPTDENPCQRTQPGDHRRGRPGACVACSCWLVFDSDDLPIIGGGTGYTAYFTEAAGLKPGNEVRVAGVKVGTGDRASRWPATKVAVTSR